MKPNYGDVALQLKPDWSRHRQSGDQSFILTTVGHENGRADAFLKDDPGKAHQFQWCAPSDVNRLNYLRGQHYKFCTNADWDKNEYLWEWDGEGYIVHNGERLMAREESYYWAAEAERDRAIKERHRKRSTSPEEEAALRRIEQRGATIEDGKGRRLKPLSPDATQPKQRSTRSKRGSRTR
jgi:hypothetical protein